MSYVTSDDCMKFELSDNTSYVAMLSTTIHDLQFTNSPSQTYCKLECETFYKAIGLLSIKKLMIKMNTCMTDSLSNVSNPDK